MKKGSRFVFVCFVLLLFFVFNIGLTYCTYNIFSNTETGE